MAIDLFIQQSEDTKNRIQSFAFVIAVGIAICFSAYFAASSFIGLTQSYEVGLDEKINPNDAAIGSLTRLPGIGLGRACAIVSYREKFSKDNSNKPAFQNVNDLQKVKGIGPKTVQNITQWLKFQ